MDAALWVQTDRVYLPGDMISTGYSRDALSDFEKHPLIASTNGAYGCLCTPFLSEDTDEVILYVDCVVSIQSFFRFRESNVESPYYLLFEPIPYENTQRRDIQCDVIERYLSLFDGTDRKQEQTWLEERLPMEGFYLSYYIANALEDYFRDVEEWEEIGEELRYDLLTKRSETKRLRILREFFKNIGD